MKIRCLEIVSYAGRHSIAVIVHVDIVIGNHASNMKNFETAKFKIDPRVRFFGIPCQAFKKTCL